MNFVRRLAEIRRYMEEHDVVASVVIKPVNQYYLSGFETITYSRLILTVIDHSRCSLILPGIEEEWGREISIADAFFPYFEHPCEASRGTSAIQHLKTLLAVYQKGSRIGVEMDAAPYGVCLDLIGLGFEPFDVAPKIASMRAIKDPDEITRIRRASEFAVIVAAATAKAAKPGLTELEVDSIGTETAKNAVREKYPGSIADPGRSMTISGVERTVMPHVLTGTRKLDVGDVVMTTRQFAVDSYCADCQRTFFVGGRRTKKQQAIYDLVVESQAAAVEQIKPGVSAKEIEQASRKVIDDAGYGEFFTHRLGKSTGLEAVEEPFIRFDSEYEVRPGMVFNILPGIYLPGIGGFRVSDTVLVTETGHEVLTEGCPKDLDELVAN